jgi:hypothetical protein
MEWSSPTNSTSLVLDYSLVLTKPVQYLKRGRAISAVSGDTFTTGR